MTWLGQLCPPAALSFSMDWREDGTILCTNICYAYCNYCHKESSKHHHAVLHTSMRAGTQYNIHLLCNWWRWGQICAVEGWNTVQFYTFCRWNVVFICYATCADEGWTTIKYFVMQLILCRSAGDGTQYSYATCANEGWNAISFIMQLVQMRGGTRENVLLFNLCRRGQTCADEGWNTIRPTASCCWEQWRWHSPITVTASPW